MSQNTDFILPFMLSNHTANGRVVKLNNSIQQIISLHEYPEFISNLLAELLVLSCFLGQNLKKEGIITCQIQSKDGLLNLMVAEYVFGGNIRGYASFAEEKFAESDYDFQQLVGSGYLVVTVESGDEKYQGIIELDKSNLSKSFESYLEKSEQIKSIVSVAVEFSNILDEKKVTASGIILKKMPAPASENEDDWERYTQFIHSVSSEELINVSAEELLKRLFHSDGVLAYDKLDISFKCRCSREKMQHVLNTISEHEIESLKVDGKIVIKCQFCSNEEVF